MTHPVMFDDADPILVRPTFRAGKILAVYGFSEKRRPGDHRRFFVPAYYGPHGGPAIDLADAELDARNS